MNKYDQGFLVFPCQGNSPQHLPNSSQQLLFAKADNLLSSSSGNLIAMAMVYSKLYTSLYTTIQIYCNSHFLPYKDNKRSNDLYSIMRDISARMSKEDIEAVSYYVAGLH